MKRLGLWLLGHWPEFLVFALGVVFRVSMHFSFDPLLGYDANQHWEVARWIADHGSIPPVTAIYCGYHPPLYYALVAALLKLGFTANGAQWMSIWFGIIKLGLVWLGLEWYLKQRAARLAGLGLAAILPVVIHMDGMITNEVASGVLSIAAMVLVPKAFEAQGRRRWVLATVIGVLIALQLLAKISALMCIAAIGIAVVLEAVLAVGVPWRARVMRALPFSMVVLVPLLLTGWYFGRNIREFGKPFLNSFDVRPEQLAEMAKLESKSYLDRRSLGFVAGWGTEIYDWPYYSSAIGDRARYFTLITAMTFVDYWNFHYSGLGHDWTSPSGVNGRQMTQDVMISSQRSMIGGTMIALAALVGWIVAAAVVWRRRDLRFVALLVLPVLTLLSGLHFGIKYPFDGEGVIKSSYLQFGMMTLYGTFGVSFAWTLERRRTWPLFVLLTVSLWLVLAYSLYCRLRIQLLPL